MIVDHRTYTLHPGKMNEYVDRYEREGLPVQSRHLGAPLGWYISMDIGQLNQVVHMWGYDSHAERDRRRALLAAAPEWRAFVPKVLPLIRDMENRILVPAPFAAVETLDWAGPQAA